MKTRLLAAVIGALLRSSYFLAARESGQKEAEHYIIESERGRWKPWQAAKLPSWSKY